MPVGYVFAFSVVALLMGYYVIRVMTARTAAERHRYLDEEEAVATAAATLVPLI